MDLTIEQIEIGDRFNHTHALIRKNGVKIPKNSKWLVVGKEYRPKRIHQLKEIIVFKGDGDGAHIGDILESSIMAVNATMERRQPLAIRATRSPNQSPQIC